MKKSDCIRYSYKALHSVVPCLMLTMSVGMIYSFSLFLPELTEVIGASRDAVQFAFNLSIFFLGMGAAFFGPLVEKDIRKASKVATALFVAGLAVTACAAQWKSLVALYVGLGVMCGLGEGIAYLCPCKNMLLWYSRSKFKGVVMAVSIVTFGLGSSLCAQLYGVLHPKLGLVLTLSVLSLVYLVMMSIGCLFIRKPRFDRSKKSRQRAGVEMSFMDGIRRYGRDPHFVSHWGFMFLNISMGLILIGSCASILRDAGLAMGTVVLVMSICGMTNGAGRIVFPLVGDMMRRKGAVISVILISELLLIAPTIWMYWMIPVAVVFINATYGGGFATCPQIVLERYGTKPLSVVHGLLLSAWGVASLFAFACTYAVNHLGVGYRALPAVLTTGYLVALAISRRVASGSRT